MANRFLAVLALVTAVLSGCAGSADGETRASGSHARSCSVTLPNRSSPPGEHQRSTFHGGPRLWTLLAEYGVFIVGSSDIASDGSISLKLPWWAVNVDQDLRISGERLDGAASALRVRVTPARPESEFRGSFWSSRVVFPSPGCWRVRAEAGTGELRLTLIIMRE